jgi:hypothetical protein
MRLGFRISLVRGMYEGDTFGTLGEGANIGQGLLHHAKSMGRKVVVHFWKACNV